MRVNGDYEFSWKLNILKECIPTYFMFLAQLIYAFLILHPPDTLNIASGQRGIHRHVFAGTELLATFLIFMFTVVYLVAEVGLNFSRKLSPSSWTLCALAKIPA